MNHYVYILKSRKSEKLYIGYTSDLRKRMIDHNSGGTRFTSRVNDWSLIYIEVFVSKQDAIKREKSLKHFGSAYSGLKRRLKNTFVDFEGGIKTPRRLLG